MRWLPPQLGLLDLEVARQYSTNLGNRNSQSQTAVRRPADDIQQFGITHIHLGDAKLIGIRMLRTLNNFADNDIRKLTGYGINTVNFQTSHGDLLSQFMAGKRGLDPLIYPGFTEFHYVAPILT